MIANNLAHGTKQQKKNWKTKNKTNVLRRNGNGTFGKSPWILYGQGFALRTLKKTGVEKYGPYDM